VGDGLSEVRAVTCKPQRKRPGRVVKGAITLALYIAIGITGAAFGQQSIQVKTIPIAVTVPTGPASVSAYDRALLEWLATDPTKKTEEQRRIELAALPANPVVIE
jgi:hypothetical protein